MRDVTMLDKEHGAEASCVYVMSVLDGEKIYTQGAPGVSLEAVLAFLPAGSEQARQITWEDFEAEHAPTLATIRAEKLAEINAACSAVLASLTASYPQAELLTFDKQEAEARALLANTTADNTAPTPLLSALSAGRGVPLAELAERVIAKADAFATVSGFVIGQRQALEDALDTCTDASAVRALTVAYTLPGQEGCAA